MYPNLLKVQTVVDTTSDKFLTSCGLSFCIRDVFLNLLSEGIEAFYRKTSKYYACKLPLG